MLSHSFTVTQKIIKDIHAVQEDFDHFLKGLEKDAAAITRIGKLFAKCDNIAASLSHDKEFVLAALFSNQIHNYLMKINKVIAEEYYFDHSIIVLHISKLDGYALKTVENAVNWCSGFTIARIKRAAYSVMEGNNLDADKHFDYLMNEKRYDEVTLLKEAKSINNKPFPINNVTKTDVTNTIEHIFGEFNFEYNRSVKNKDYSNANRITNYKIKLAILTQKIGLIVEKNLHAECYYQKFQCLKNQGIKIDKSEYQTFLDIGEVSLISSAEKEFNESDFLSLEKKPEESLHAESLPDEQTQELVDVLKTSTSVDKKPQEESKEQKLSALEDLEQCLNIIEFNNQRRLELIQKNIHEFLKDYKIESSSPTPTQTLELSHKQLHNKMEALRKHSKDFISFSGEAKVNEIQLYKLETDKDASKNTADLKQVLLKKQNFFHEHANIKAAIIVNNALEAIHFVDKYILDNNETIGLIAVYAATAFLELLHRSDLISNTQLIATIKSKFININRVAILINPEFIYPRLQRMLFLESADNATKLINDEVHLIVHSKKIKTNSRSQFMEYTDEDTLLYLNIYFLKRYIQSAQYFLDKNKSDNQHESNIQTTLEKDLSKSDDQNTSDDKSTAEKVLKLMHVSISLLNRFKLLYPNALYHEQLAIMIELKAKAYELADNKKAAELERNKLHSLTALQKSNTINNPSPSNPPKSELSSEEIAHQKQKEMEAQEQKETERRKKLADKRKEKRKAKKLEKSAKESAKYPEKLNAAPEQKLAEPPKEIVDEMSIIAEDSDTNSVMVASDVDTPELFTLETPEKATHTTEQATDKVNVICNDSEVETNPLTPSTKDDADELLALEISKSSAIIEDVVQNQPTEIESLERIPDLMISTQAEKLASPPVIIQENKNEPTPSILNLFDGFTYIPYTPNETNKYYQEKQDFYNKNNLTSTEKVNYVKSFLKDIIEHTAHFKEQLMHDDHLARSIDFAAAAFQQFKTTYPHIQITNNEQLHHMSKTAIQRSLDHIKLAQHSDPNKVLHFIHGIFLSILNHPQDKAEIVPDVIPQEQATIELQPETKESLPGSSFILHPITEVPHQSIASDPSLNSYPTLFVHMYTDSSQPNIMFHQDATPVITALEQQNMGLQQQLYYLQQENLALKQRNVFLESQMAQNNRSISNGRSPLLQYNTFSRQPNKEYKNQQQPHTTPLTFQPGKVIVRR